MLFRENHLLLIRYQQNKNCTEIVLITESRANINKNYITYLKWLEAAKICCLNHLRNEIFHVVFSKILQNYAFTYRRTQTFVAKRGLSQC